MPLPLHWKATAGMLAAYTVICAAALTLIHDRGMRLTVILGAFFVALFAGNIFIRRRARGRAGAPRSASTAPSHPYNALERRAMARCGPPDGLAGSSGPTSAAREKGPGRSRDGGL
ncbi:MAG: hypothetical protein ACUVV6_08310 [Thermoplasmatota archaeon]